MENYNR